MEIKKIQFQRHGDARGMLVALEENKEIPFKIKRVYYLYDTLADVTRGYHAHKSLQQILICVHGSCKIRLDDGHENGVVTLDKPDEGIYVGNNMWREMFDFSPDAVLMVLASELYDEKDYIRDYDEFLKYITKMGGGNRTLGYFVNQPFATRRVYYMFGSKQDVIRGCHAHKKLRQLLICIKGSCDVVIDEIESKRTITLGEMGDGLLIEPFMWHEMKNFSDDAVLLVLASDLYNEEDYIRDYNTFLNFWRHNDKIS